ncbi:MAG TPA: cupin domain-containing protein [Opitutaceae bacterium]|nr:cupin domain-containing protein [Opitutaceae bacterium]
MKRFLLCSILAAGPLVHAQSAAPAAKAGNLAAPAALLASGVYDWTKMTVTPTATGERRAVFDAPTSTVDRVHCHITTLNPGKSFSDPVLHLQEEIIIVKEGTVEASVDGRLLTAGPGSIFYLAAHAVTRMRNVGDVPATYFVVSYYTPLTPKK